MWWKILIIVGIVLYLFTGFGIGLLAGTLAATSQSSIHLWKIIKIILFWPFMLFL